MAEYISKTALDGEVAKLEELARNRYLDTPSNSLAYPRYTAQMQERASLKHLIADFPAADVAPVRHGRWIEPSRLYYDAKQYECSLCCSDTFWKKHSITEKYPHCPNCGAKMDGGDGNSDMA